MTHPTRRQLMAGSVAAVGAAGAPAIAIAADPEERVRLAVQELLAAAQARWPNAVLNEVDELLDEETIPVFMLAVHRR